MKSVSMLIIFTCVFCVLFATVPPSYAENRAFEQLLEIFEKKGVLTLEEVNMLKQTMTQELERLTDREREIESQERALLQREEELKKKEDALQKTAVIRDRADRAVDLGAPATAPETDDKDKPRQAKSSQDMEAPAGSLLTAKYQDGLCLSTQDAGTFSLCIGSLVQTDYRYFHYDGADPNNNEFDIRRARLLLSGRLLQHFDYKFEYEFQGAESRNLLDAYVDILALPFASLRIGQFKEPFGLEQYTPDKNLFFAERSMGFYLTPGRDVGLMAHASLLKDAIDYYLGVFNGNGTDDSTGGDSDAPQITGRLVFAPFRNQGIAVVDDLQFGGSASYAKIDSNNVDIHVKTTGLTEFFDVSSNAKFAIIQNADQLTRYGAELGWACGPLALMSEYVHSYYKEVSTSSSEFNIKLHDYYIDLLWMLTGEHPAFGKGVLQPIKPLASVWDGGWGGIGLAARYDHWEADKGVYDDLVQPGNSVRKADAYTIALNWWLNSFARFILDFTRTDFDRPLLIDRNSRTGQAEYSDSEDVLTARFQFGF
jgi:phosphate-selective porin OprO/OprP